ncbi:ATP-binding protein [Sphaerisporangium sp. NPDC051017]|uniref:ATP-binding protein n=1 Tax=Sphaerisporangium sp. NPDC051017 TaxID=3154636 RepID=UPI003414B73D
MRTGSLLGVAELVASDEAPKAARDYVKKVLDEGHPAYDDVVLLACELVTNSALHSDSRDGGRITLSLADCLEVIYAEVTDAGGDNFPQIINDPLAESGRGLRIVRATAQVWGIRESRTERTIWFQIAYKPRPVIDFPRQRESPGGGADGLPSRQAREALPL